MVESDHQPLEIILKKPIGSAPRRIQRMMLELQRYELTVTYRRGTALVLADTLSRAFVPAAEDVPVLDERVCQVVSQRDIETVDPVNEVFGVSDQRLKEMAEYTKNDDTLQLLQDILLSGWPKSKQDVPVSLHPYFHVRDDFVVADGIILKGSRCVIPEALRPKLLELHTAHMGVEGTLRQARESIYWPGINAVVKDYISRCEVCAALRTHTQTREPLMQHDRPTRPWAKVGCDLFTLEVRQNKFLITADYWSNYFDIDELKTADATRVIRSLRRQFATHGIPDEVVTDNGPPFQSQEFKEFADKWMFKHTTTSPYHSQANGLVESAVKTAKSILRTALYAGDDPWLAILAHRNMLTEGMDTSPVQRLMSHCTKTLLSVRQAQLQPTVTLDRDQQQLRRKLELQKCRYDVNTKHLSPLVTGDVVRVRPPQLGRREWAEATIVGTTDEPRSYVVATGTATVRRNRRDLVKQPPKEDIMDKTEFVSAKQDEAAARKDEVV